MPQGGMLMPIPSVAPAAAGAVSANVPMAPKPYGYQAVPPASDVRQAPASRKGGLSGFAITMIIIMCFLVGGGVYYFLNRTGTTSTLNSAINNSLLIQDISPSPTETGATIKWTTDKPATSQVNYGKTEEYGSTTQLDTNLSPSHSVALTGLDPNTTYYFKAISTDATGTETTSVGTLTTTAAVTTDKTPPTISGVNVSNVTESGAIITWVTDEPATSQIKYGKTETYGSTTPLDTKLTTTHNVTLTTLDSATTYDFSIISTDAAGNQATSATNRTFTTLTPIPVGIQVGNRAPDFTLQNLDGQNVTLSSYRGQIVMINFWATWCDPCKAELPYIQSVSNEWSGKGVVVLEIAVQTNEQLDTVKQFISQNSYTFPVLFDSQGINSVYNATYLPTTFFIDAEGIVSKVQVGSFQDQPTIENVLNSIK
jgi:peroxiredoxin